MNTTLLIALSFLALPFVVNAVVQTAQKRHQLGGLGTALAIIGLAGPLLALAFGGAAAVTFVLGNAIVALLIGGVILVIERRSPAHDLRYSIGLTGMLVGGLLLAVVLMGSLAAPVDPVLMRENPATTATANEDLVLMSGAPDVAAAAEPADVDDAPQRPAEAQQPTRERMPMPSPTPTRAPLEYELPTYAQELGLEPVCDVSAVSNLNIRSGPGTHHNVLTSVTASTRLSVMGTDDAGEWLEIRYQGLNGWVSADFVLGLGACVNLN